MTPEFENRLESESRSILYSTFGYLHPRKAVWRIPIQGRIYREQPASFSQRMMLRGLRRALKLAVDDDRNPIFQQRVAGFLTKPVPGVRVHVDYVQEMHRLRGKSRASGLIQTKVDIPRERVPPEVSVIHVDALGDFAASRGKVFLAGTSGLSIISDIDDTIKETEVTNRSRMLERTFLEPFAPIAGMAEVFRSMAERGALFHYVSSSPWQLYESLENFLVSHQFPVGSMHLKWFRLRDEFFKGWQVIRRKNKAGIIASMIKRMPYRRFVLIGDSGERDPEIYAKIARKFPYQVVGCAIRDLEARPIDAKRLERLSSKLGIVPLRVFREPAELATTLDQIQSAN